MQNINHNSRFCALMIIVLYVYSAKLSLFCNHQTTDNSELRKNVSQVQSLALPHETDSQQVFIHVGNTNNARSDILLVSFVVYRNRKVKN